VLIGVDLGGTNIAAGLIGEQNELISLKSRPTRPERGAEAIADDIAAMCGELAGKRGISVRDLGWVGVGSPGSVDPEKRVIHFAGNLGFKDTPLGEMLSSRLSVPVFLGNDGNAAALGELYAGAARGYDSALLVTLGTGIGGGIVLGGRVHTGFNGMAGEIGHMVISEGGRKCSCGRKGCWEAYASATGLIALSREAMEEDKSSLMWELAGSAERVSGRTSFDAMRRGDLSAKKVVDAFIRYLACGVSNLINILQPAVVCVGGGISREGDALLAPLRRQVSRESFDVGGRRCERAAAELGNDAGIIGAAMLGKQ
jgi:glucokinase